MNISTSALLQRKNGFCIIRICLLLVVLEASRLSPLWTTTHQKLATEILKNSPIRRKNWKSCPRSQLFVQFQISNGDKYLAICIITFFEMLYVVLCPDH